MDTYLDKETQTKEERDSIKDSRDFLHNNSSINNLYSPDH